MRRAAGERGAVGLVPWGDPVEAFLSPLGLTLHDFAERMDGGWLFGWIEALKRAGREAFVMCPSSSVTEITRLTHAGTGAAIWAVPGRAAPDGPGTRASLRRWAVQPRRAFAEVMRRTGCGALVVQEYEYARFDVLVLTGRALGVPVFATFQGADAPASRAEAAVRRATLPLAAGLIAASARERARLSAAYRRRPPVHDVPNPLDAQAWAATPRAAARAELGIAPDAFVAVTHGRVDVSRKGLDVLIEAWRRFARDRPEARLLLVGSGQGDGELQALIDAAPVPGLEWARAYVTDRDFVRARLSAADVYVTASRVEGMPVAPLEAMAAGLPVIATDAHGLPDVFAEGRAHGGIVLPRGDPAALAAALAETAADPALRTSLSRAAVERVTTRYDLDSVGRALAGVLG